MSGTWCSITTSVRPSSAREREEPVAQRVRLLRAEAGGGFVEEQQVGAGGDRGRDLDDPHRAVGQVAEPLVGEVIETEQLEGDVGAPAQLSLRRATVEPNARMPAAVGYFASHVWASSTFSRTVSARTRPMSWNVRASPNDVRRAGGFVSSSIPR